MSVRAGGRWYNQAVIPLRDENPTRITPYVTWILATVNILIFLGELGGAVPDGWALVPAEITRGIDYDVNGPSLHPLWLTIFSSMFLHGGWSHLLSNMLFLIIFGNNIEDALGHARYLFFYLCCGAAAALTQIAYHPDSGIPMVGASGAIAGVLGGYLILYPSARVNTLVFLGFFLTTARIPALFLLGFWIVSQFFNQVTGALLTGGREVGGVAYLAHIGGFVVGMALIKLLGAQANAPLPKDEDDSPRW